MKQDALHARFEDPLDILVVESLLTVYDHFVALHGHHLASVRIGEVLYPRAEHAGGQPTAFGGLQSALADLDLLGQTENVDDVLVALQTDCAQKSSHGEFLLAVDVGVHHVVDVSGKLDPRAAERDDTAAVELRAVGMHALAEEYARRTMELRHDHALGTVDHKSALFRHIRDRPQINVLDHRVEILVVGIGTVELQLGL